MKKKMFAIITAVAIAPPALAQGEAWQFELVGGVGTEANPLRPGQASATVRLSIGAPAGDYALGGINWYAHADEPGWADPETLLLQPGLEPGEVRGRTVGLCSVGQLTTCAGGFTVEPGRLDVWQATFTVAEFTRREVNLWTETMRYEVYTADPCLFGPGELAPREAIEGLAAIFVAPSCYADCDGSGSLDLMDFLCFQNAFAAGEPYADCDGSGEFDVFDFLCFQNEFAAGCP